MAATATAAAAMIDPSYIALGVVVAIAIFMVGWYFGTRKGHKHMWDHMMSNDLGWDWYYCRECLTECCQKLDMTNGTITERNEFTMPKPSKSKNKPATTIAK